MVIDAHTHIFPEQLAKKAVGSLLKSSEEASFKAFSDGTLKGLLKSMKDALIDYSVVLPIATKIDQFKPILDWILEEREKNPSLIFLASIHPKDPQFEKNLDLIAKKGFKGIKLHPQFQSFNADDKELYPFYEAVIKRKLFLHFHAGIDVSFLDSDAASIQRFAHIISDFPDLKLVLAHAGGVEDWENTYTVLKSRNVYFDISFAIQALKDEHPFLTKLCREKGDFALFGTDSPWRDQKTDLEIFKSLSSLSQEQKEKILYKNALKLLGTPK